MTPTTRPPQPACQAAAKAATAASARQPAPAYGIPLPVDLTGSPAPRYLAHGEWRQSATCRRGDFAWWFAKPTSARGRAAVRLCEQCPVRRECLAAGLLYGEEFGLWGGVNHLERRSLIVRLLRGESLGSVLTSALGSGSETNRTEVA